MGYVVLTLGTLTRQAAWFLEAAVVSGLRILVAGGPRQATSLIANTPPTLGARARMSVRSERLNRLKARMHGSG